MSYIVILAGDHVYKMDYGIMLAQHVDSGADVTVGCIEVPRMEAAGFGVMHVDDSSRIVRFAEKPADPSGIPGDPGRSYSHLEGVVALPYSVINRNARLTRVVLDRGVNIPDGLVVGEDPELDARRFRMTGEGVTLITQAMIDALDD